MARKPRWVPEGGALVEITCRTLQSRLLLRPSRRLNEIVVGALARAKRRYPAKIIALTCLSNHMHLLAWFEDAGVQGAFMRYLNTKLSKEVGRLVDWRQRVWGRRFDPIVVSDEEEAQIARLRYVLSQGVKERLVARPGDWPGVHSVEALLTGQPLRGYWFDRTREYAARRRGREYGVYDFADEETLELDPLPCWAHLSPDLYRLRIAQLVTDIENEHRCVDEGLDPAILGVEAILRQNPHEKPLHTKTSPRPLFHTATRRVFRELYAAYSWFVGAYYDAVERLRAGCEKPRFPEGCFPPAMPFIPYSRAP